MIVTATMSASDRMASLLDKFGRNVRVVSVPAPGLVEHVEAADLDSPELRSLVERFVRPLLDQGADTIVLGSTHYVFLRPVIAEVAGDGVTLVDTGAAVARQLERCAGRNARLRTWGHRRERAVLDQRRSRLV